MQIPEKSTAGVKEAAEKGRTECKSQRKVPQGLKPGTHFAATAARLKSCPFAFRRTAGVFPQPVKPQTLFAALTARLKSCPDTSCFPDAFFPETV